MELGGTTQQCVVIKKLSKRSRGTFTCSTTLANCSVAIRTKQATSIYVVCICHAKSEQKNGSRHVVGHAASQGTVRSKNSTGLRKSSRHGHEPRAEFDQYLASLQILSQERVLLDSQCAAVAANISSKVFASSLTLFPSRSERPCSAIES